MRDFIDIGSTPAGESCAQVGSENYQQQSIKECRAFINQLRRTFGLEIGTAKLAVKANPHDFGTYHEVVCYFDSNDDIGQEYAYNCENSPENWDAEALVELETEPLTKQEIQAQARKHAESIDEDELESMSNDGVCEAADGCSVEPDGTCQHGYPSPLLVLGLI